MADGRLRVIGVPPSGPGLRRAVQRFVKDGTVVTSLDDAKLHALRQFAPDDVEADFAPLGDLVGRYLTMLGEPIARLCPRGQLQATVDLACKELPSDSPLAQSSRFRGTADLITERLSELRDWGISTEDLERAAQDATPITASKLRSLAAVDAAVRSVMDETNRQFASTRVERCLGVPPDGPLPVRRVVVAVAGAEKPLYESWLRWLLGFGADVYVLVDHVPDAPHLFAVSARCAGRLGERITPEKGESWCSCLFSDAVASSPPSIEIVNAADPLSEAEWAMRGCLAEIRNGTMPHRIGVFARNSEDYAPLLMSAAERLGVPLSASVTAPLLTNGFASLTLRCLEALAGEDVRALSRLAHSSYLRVGLEKDHALTEASRAAFVRGPEQWRALAEWARGEGPDLEWLRSLLQWREQVTSSRAPLSGWLLRLRELVGATQMVDAAAESDVRTKNRDLRAQTVMQRSIGDLAYVYDRSGRPELSLSGFATLAREVWENDTHVVEGRANGVVHVSNAAAFTEYDVLFVVGMLEGTLPRRRTEDPILFDEERAELSHILGRMHSLPDSRTRAAAERDEFVRICSAATKKLVLSYPQTDESRDNVPAFYLDEIARACPGTKRTTRPRSHFVPLKGECMAPSDVAIRGALDGPRAAIEPPLLNTEAGKAAVRPNLEKGVSPEELARALVCPFQSTVRNRLRLIAPARRRLMRSLRDLPASIATNSDPASARTGLSRAIDDYLQEMYPEFEPWELAMLGAAARRLAEEWVTREFKARELWKEEGETTWTGVSLDQHGLKNELKVGDKKLRLLGKATSLTQRKGYSVLRFFDSSTPDLMETTEVAEDNEDAFLYGLYLMAQLHLPQRNPTVEVDGMDGKRILAGFKDIRRMLGHDPAAGLEVLRVSDSRDVFFQNVMNRLRQSVEVLDRADMQAVPGRHCEPCPYGELCRVSSVFGEASDPFLEEGE
jgi:hypothetical protein